MDRQKVSVGLLIAGTVTRRGAKPRYMLGRGNRARDRAEGMGGILNGQSGRKEGGEKLDRNCYPVWDRAGDPPAKAERRALAAVGPPFPCFATCRSAGMCYQKSFRHFA